MTTTHTPSARYRLRDAIDSFIYKPAEAKLHKQLETIMNSHSIDDPHHSLAFMYKGCVYSPQNYRSNHRIHLLNQRLYPEMDAWKQKERELTHERLAVSNFLSFLLLEANNVRDLYALLPECLHPALSNLSDDQPATVTDEEAQKFQETYSKSIHLIKQRLVYNLIS